MWGHAHSFTSSVSSPRPPHLPLPLYPPLLQPSSMVIPLAVKPVAALNTYGVLALLSSPELHAPQARLPPLSSVAPPAWTGRAALQLWPWPSMYPPTCAHSVAPRSHYNKYDKGRSRSDVSTHRDSGALCIDAESCKAESRSIDVPIIFSSPSHNM